MLKRFRDKKKNNKGFTLVELVVVVAILAILVGLLAPQYTKYVERAKQSADANALENMVRAVELEATDPVTKLVPGTYVIKMDKIGAVTVTDNSYPTNKDSKAAIETAIKNALGDEALNTTLKSKTWSEEGIGISATITIDDGTLDPDKTGAVTVTYAPKSFAEYVRKTETPSIP